MCGAPDQDTLPSLEVSAGEAVIHGHVTRDGAGLPGAYVRLLDGTGEFTAEVVTSPEGEFRFFAAPGTWKVRALASVGKGERLVDAELGLTETTVVVDQ